MEEKNKKNKQELDKKDELRRLVLDYIGEKDTGKAETNKLLNKKEPKFSKIEQIQATSAKDDKKNKSVSKINKEDIDNARKEILAHTEGEKVLPVKKTEIKSIGVENKKIKKENRTEEKNKEKTKREIPREMEKVKEKGVLKFRKDEKIKFNKKDFCIINIIALIVVSLVLLFMILILTH